MAQTLLAIAVFWILAVAAWWLLAVPFLRRGPRGDAITGLLWRILRVYGRVLHRVTYVRQDLLPADETDLRGLIVVSNHTSAADPLLIQARCRFWIRWMMARETMLPQLQWLWKRERIIAVDRDGRDSAALREAIRHIKDGGAVGIFPEGGIADPPEEIRPFMSGISVLINRTQAPVLLVWVSGTPRTELMKALVTPSHARVEFVELMEFEGRQDPEAITERLRERLSEASGWPLNDEPLPTARGNGGGVRSQESEVR